MMNELNRGRDLQVRPDSGLFGGRFFVVGGRRRSGELPVGEEKNIRLFAAVTHTDHSPGRWKINIPYSKINPGHFKMSPGRSEINPGYSEISPGRSKMSPGHFKINPGRSEMSPGHSEINPGRSEMSPGHFKINPGHLEMSPGLPGIIFKPGRVVFISRKHTLECRGTKTKALRNKNLIQGEKKWIM